MAISFLKKARVALQLIGPKVLERVGGVLAVSGGKSPPLVLATKTAVYSPGVLFLSLPRSLSVQLSPTLVCSTHAAVGNELTS